MKNITSKHVFLCVCVVCGPLTVVASPVAEHRLRTRRLSGHGSRAQPLRDMWNLPGPGLEPVSPASAGGLSTTAPPGKPENEKTFKHKLKMRNWVDCIVESALVRSGKGILPTKCSQLTLNRQRYVHRASLGVQWKRRACQCRAHRFEPWPGRSHMPRSS